MEAFLIIGVLLTVMGLTLAIEQLIGRSVHYVLHAMIVWGSASIAAWFAFH